MASSDETHPMFDARNGIHAGLTAIMAWIALRLALNEESFTTNPNFVFMARLGPEQMWALAFWTVANIGVVGLASRQSVLRLASVLIVATAHGVFAGCLLMSGSSMDSGTYAIIASMGYYLAYRRTRAGI